MWMPHSNANVTHKEPLPPGDLNWVQHWVSRLGLLTSQTAYLSLEEHTKTSTPSNTAAAIRITEFTLDSRIRPFTTLKAYMKKKETLRNGESKPRLQISAGHRTFVRQIWGFDRETVQSDRTAWRASPVKMVISPKKANFNVWLWWITAKFPFDLCPLKVFVSLNWKQSCYCHQYSWNEDMILALVGQFKQLSHEPEKFRWLNGIRTHDLCDAGAVL